MQQKQVESIISELPMIFASVNFQISKNNILLTYSFVEHC